MQSQQLVAEVKQMTCYFSFIMDRLKISSQQTAEPISEHEIEMIDKTKAKLNDFHQGMLLNSQQSLVPFFKICLKSIIQNETYPTNLLRVTIKTLIKIFELADKEVHLKESGKEYNPLELVDSLMVCRFDDHSNQIDKQELIWLEIQKLIIAVISKVDVSEEQEGRIFLFFRGLLFNRGFTCDSRQGQTVHFTEKIKKNTLRLLKLLFSKDQRQKRIFELLAKLVLDAIKIYHLPIELDENKQPKISQLEKNSINEKELKTICFGIKAAEEILHNYAKDHELNEFIIANIGKLVELTCLASEQPDIIVKSLAQSLFKLLMHNILSKKLPLREQFEILYVKCALKPVLTRMKKLREKVEPEAGANPDQQKKPEEDDQLSENETEDNVQAIGDPLLHASSYAQVKHEASQLNEKDFLSDYQFELSFNFLVDTILSLQPEDLGLLFLDYDCQHFSESIVTKSLNLIIKYSKGNQDKFSKIFLRLSQCLAKLETVNNIDSQLLHVTHQRIKYILDTKSQQKTLARQCNIKPKLFLNKCQEIYGLVDKEAPWDIASKILLFSRELIVEHVTEILGGKEDRNKAIYAHFLDKQDWRDRSLLNSLRRVMQTFRLAGVESQCVTRVLEGFGEKFFQYDTSKTFFDHEEAYEMAFLMIVLQTTQHNPNIKQKLRVKDFEMTAQSNCPKSWDQLPSDYVEIMFEDIKAEEIFSPLMRSWYNQSFNKSDLMYCQIKLSSFEESKLISANEFVNLADLTSHQLFNFNNNFNPIKDEESPLMIHGALRHISQMLTSQFLKVSKLQDDRDSEVIYNMLQVNQSLQNYRFTDQLLRSLYSIDQNNETLIKEIIKNFDKGAQNTVTLIPQLIISSQNVTTFASIDRHHLLEICQSAERYFRSKLADSQTAIKRQIMVLEGKSVSEIDEELKKQKGASQSQQQMSSSSAEASSSGSGYSLVNIVFNYFNESPEDAALSGPKGEKIQRLKERVEKLKTDQTEHMKFMNKMFNTLVKPSDSDQICEDSPSFQTFIEGQLFTLLEKILIVFRENLHSILQSNDGLYCLIFIKNCISVLTDDECKLEGKSECINLIWQEIHAIISKLTKTKRKVNVLGLDTSQGGLNESFSSDQRQEEDDNLSNLDASQSSEISLNNSSSEQSLSNLDKIYSTNSDGSKIVVSFSNKRLRNYERRVYQSLGKHLLLDTYFEINKYMLMNITGFDPLVSQQQNYAEIQKKLVVPEIQRNIKECIREVQRVFKSIINGPVDKNEDESDVQEEERLTCTRMFDDLHVIICMNKLLCTEFKEIDPDTQKEERILPIAQYDKIFKLLRNLIIHTSQSIDDTQIEVYVQNSDSFIEVLSNCLKYISISMLSSKKLVPYHLISLLLQLIGKITQKSRAINVSVPIPQFLNIFEKIFNILSIQNQYDLWLEAMKQYQQTLILNKGLIYYPNELTFNHVFLIYKNQSMMTEMEVYGEKGSKQQSMAIKQMFDQMFFSLDFQKMVTIFELKKPSDQVFKNLKVLIKHHLETTSDVLIQVIAQIYQEPESKLNKEIFVSLWLPYLKAQLKFVEQLRDMAPKVQDNLSRVLEFLMVQDLFLETDTKLWNESWKVIGSFFPELKQKLCLKQ